MPTKKTPAKKPAKKPKSEQSEQPLKKRVRGKKANKPKEAAAKPDALLVVEQPQPAAEPDLSPKQADIEAKKKAFLLELEINGGNVTQALRKADLKRTTAYEHLATDPAFAAEWKDSLEFGYDELFAEARTRAVEGDLKAYVGKDGEVHEVREKSDTLLIFLMKNAEAQKKWRDRVLDMGRRAIVTLRSEAAKQKVAPETVRLIEEAMFTAFDKVPLV